MDFPPPRQLVENVEIGILSLIVFIGSVLNVVVFIQLLRRSRTPTANTSFSTGPYHLTSFALFKLNLCITDFAILFFYALGKIIWLCTFEWSLFGERGCQMYQFLSALAFYAHSNVVAAIGLDRVKVVCSRHIQGAASVRRVRSLLIACWLFAALCALPQLFVWTTYSVDGEWQQCVTVFKIIRYNNQSTEYTQNMELLYELSHMALVFWIPFSVIFISYVYIVLRLLQHSFRPDKNKYSRPPTSGEHPFAMLDRLDRMPDKKRSIAMGWISTGARKISQVSNRSVSVFFCCSRPEYHPQPTISLPMWRRQLRSRIFLTALAVVATHVALWLPYNLISSLRFLSPEWFDCAMGSGAGLLEDLIVLASLINPLIYAHKHRAPAAKLSALQTAGASGVPQEERAKSFGLSAGPLLSGRATPLIPSMRAHSADLV